MKSEGHLQLYRSMIFPLQCCGVFPYTVDKEIHQGKFLTFSVRLTLWCVFCSLFTIPAPFYAYNVLKPLDSSYVGNIALDIAISTVVIYCVLLNAIMMIKSSTSALLEQTYSHMFLYNASAKDAKKIRFKYLVVFIINLPIFVFLVKYGLDHPEDFDLPSSFFGPMSFYCLAMRTEIFIIKTNATFFLLAENTVARVSEAIANSSCRTIGLLPGIKSSPIGEVNTNGQYMESKDKAFTIEPFLEMERIFCQVENCKTEIISHYFEGITGGLLMTIVGLTATSYAVLTGNMISGVTPVIAFILLFIMIYTCNTGDKFSKKIGKAKGLLKEFSSNTHDRDIKEQVNRLIGYLNDIEIFNICGWYRLDYSTFVSSMSFVVAYLVILMQMGQTSFTQLTQKNN